MALTLVAKKTTWLRLLLTELGLLGISEQYAEMKMNQESSRIKQILADIRDEEGKVVSLRA